MPAPRAVTNRSYWANARTVLRYAPSMMTGVALADRFLPNVKRGRRVGFGMQLGYDLERDGVLHCGWFVPTRETDALGRVAVTFPTLRGDVESDWRSIFRDGSFAFARHSDTSRLVFAPLRLRGLWICFGLLIRPKRLSTVVEGLEAGYEPSIEDDIGTQISDLTQAQVQLEQRMRTLLQENEDLLEQAAGGQRVADFQAHISRLIMTGAPPEVFEHEMCAALWSSTGLKRCISFAYDEESDALVAVGKPGGENNAWASEHPDNTRDIEHFLYEPGTGLSELRIPRTKAGQKAMFKGMLLRAWEFYRKAEGEPGREVGRRIVYGLPSLKQRILESHPRDLTPVEERIWGRLERGWRSGKLGIDYRGLNSTAIGNGWDLRPTTTEEGVVGVEFSKYVEVAATEATNSGKRVRKITIARHRADEIDWESLAINETLRDRLLSGEHPEILRRILEIWAVKINFLDRAGIKRKVLDRPQGPQEAARAVLDFEVRVEGQEGLVRLPAETWEEIFDVAESILVRCFRIGKILVVNDTDSPNEPLSPFMVTMWDSRSFVVALKWRYKLVPDESGNGGYRFVKEKTGVYAMDHDQVTIDPEITGVIVKRVEVLTELAAIGYAMHAQQAELRRLNRELEARNAQIARARDNLAAHFDSDFAREAMESQRPIGPEAPYGVVLAIGHLRQARIKEIAIKRPDAEREFERGITEIVARHGGEVRLERDPANGNITFVTFFDEAPTSSYLASTPTQTTGRAGTGALLAARELQNAAREIFGEPLPAVVVQDGAVVTRPTLECGVPTIVRSGSPGDLARGILEVDVFGRKTTTPSAGVVFVNPTVMGTLDAREYIQLLETDSQRVLRFTLNCNFATDRKEYYDPAPGLYEQLVSFRDELIRDGCIEEDETSLSRFIFDVLHVANATRLLFDYAPVEFPVDLAEEQGLVASNLAVLSEAQRIMVPDSVSRDRTFNLGQMNYYRYMWDPKRSMPLTPGGEPRREFYPRGNAHIRHGVDYSNITGHARWAEITEAIAARLEQAMDAGVIERPQVVEVPRPVTADASAEIGDQRPADRGRGGALQWVIDRVRGEDRNGGGTTATASSEVSLALDPPGTSDELGLQSITADETASGGPPLGVQPGGRTGEGRVVSVPQVLLMRMVTPFGTPATEAHFGNVRHLNTASALRNIATHVAHEELVHVEHRERESYFEAASAAVFAWRQPDKTGDNHHWREDWDAWREERDFGIEGDRLYRCMEQAVTALTVREHLPSSVAGSAEVVRFFLIRVMQQVARELLIVGGYFEDGVLPYYEDPSSLPAAEARVIDRIQNPIVLTVDDTKLEPEQRAFAKRRAAARGAAGPNPPIPEEVAMHNLATHAVQEWCLRLEAGERTRVDTAAGEALVAWARSGVSVWGEDWIRITGVRVENDEFGWIETSMMAAASGVSVMDVPRSMYNDEAALREFVIQTAQTIYETEIGQVHHLADRGFFIEG